MDRGLVERARAGDREAFSALAAASLGRLYAVAVLILHDPAAAEDAIQEALLSAWRDLRALRDPDAWEAWTYRLTVRACHRAARSERQRVIRMRVLSDWEPANQRDDVDSMADRDQLERALQHVGPQHRAVLVLHFYVGLPLTDVADVLGVPVGTAKSRLNRGLEALRRQLAVDTVTTGSSSREGTA